MFVADPGLAPSGEKIVYAHPDSDSGSGTSWRDVLSEYNNNYEAGPGHNPHCLLSAWQLYSPPIYARLADRFGLDRLYILSAGWGLIRADFLTPNYDITFSSARNVEKFKRRSRSATYRDFCLPPSVRSEAIVFFGARSYVPLFCELTASATGPRTVFYAGSEPSAPGCTLAPFGKPFTNWQYQCAKAFVRDAPDSH